jgi:hypothetical protein
VEETARKFTNHGKALNPPNRESDESWYDYFQRLMELSDNGKYLWANAWASIDDRETGESLMDVWHEVQDRTFG